MKVSHKGAFQTRLPAFFASLCSLERRRSHNTRPSHSHHAHYHALTTQHATITRQLRPTHQPPSAFLRQPKDRHLRLRSGLQPLYPAC
jgi:hypothetical protein